MTKDYESDPFAQRDLARQLARSAMRSGLPGTSSKTAAADPPAAVRRKPLPWFAAGGVLLALLIGGGVFLWPHSPQKHIIPISLQVSGAPVIASNEAGILAAPQDELQIFRLAAAPRVLVLAFPSLHEQAMALDRIGAFVEKASMPHDRVVSAAEFGTRLAAAGEDFDTFYYGHDYRAADLRRFFATTAAEKLELNPEEAGLQTLLTEQGMLQPNAIGAVISLPPESARPAVDAQSRATILRHEVSHGVYFTDPAYAAYTEHFWSDAMTEAERAAFRKLLGNEGYDITDDDLMRNEMQAYLVHTPDRRFFNPSTMGIDATGLRAKFVDGMPAGWLKDETR